jgi:hypothetical protein
MEALAAAIDAAVAAGHRDGARVVQAVLQTVTPPLDAQEQAIVRLVSDDVLQKRARA